MQNSFNSSDSDRTSRFRGAYVDIDDLLSLRFQAMRPNRLRRSRAASQNGARLAKTRGRGVDFAEVRSYQPGDDIRNIDWRVTARTNSPHTKVFREEKERPTLVVVDQSRTMFFGSERRLKSVAAAEVGAIAAWHALNEHDRVGGFILDHAAGHMYPPKHSAKAVARFLNGLAEQNQALSRTSPGVTPEALGEQLQRLTQQVRSNYRVYVVSDFLPFGEFWLDHLRKLAHYNEVIAVRIFDPLEQQLPSQDSYSVTDGDRRFQFDASDARLRREYQAKFANLESRLVEQLTSIGVDYSTLATSATDVGSERWL